MKFDENKPRPSLTYLSFLSALSEVRQYGIDKYGDSEDWRNTDNYNERYIDACLRHIYKYIEGEDNDPESGLPHLSHAATNLMFLIEGDKDDKSTR